MKEDANCPFAKTTRLKHHFSKNTFLGSHKLSINTTKYINLDLLKRPIYFFDNQPKQKCKMTTNTGRTKNLTFAQFHAIAMFNKKTVSCSMNGK